MLWLDAARAFAVIAVVLSHYQVYVMSQAIPDPGGLERIWPEIVTQLKPIRMPLLLFMSGMLASSRLLGSAIGAGTRSVSSFYLNTVWVTVYFLISIPLNISSAGATDSVRSWILHIILPSENLWFVWALGFWALLFIFLRKLPTALVISLFIITGVAGDMLRGDIPSRWVAVLVYGIFFVLGVYARDTMFSFVASNLMPKAVVLAAAYIGMHFVFRAQKLDPIVRSLAIDVRSLIAIGLFACIFALLVKMRWLARPLAFIGRHTLSIFVMHMPLLWGLMEFDWLLSVISPAGLEILWPIIGTTLLVATSLAMEWVFRSIKCTFLFDMPRILSPAWHRSHHRK